jgi:predicted regulator of Ras-like GTPase activity (Roadblock/LC7/MglB family)
VKTLPAGKVHEILADLTATEGVLGSTLLGLDGIIIADNFVVEVNAEKLGALLANVYNTLQDVFDELKQGDVKQAWFETDRYRFLVQAVPVGLLVVVGRHDAPLGLIRLATRQTVTQLEQAGAPT